MTVSYNRPSKRDRIIFGGLIPFGQVWRTGADASTKVSFSTSVEIQSTKIEAGEYELYTIPGKDKWILIFQQNASKWGSYSYDENQDIARFEVTPELLPEVVESFTIGFTHITSKSAVLELTWDQIRVPLLISINIEKTVIPQLEAALLSDQKPSLFLAAMFYFDNQLDINRSAELMSMAIDQNPKHMGMLYRWALILERKGDIPAAITAAERSLTEANASAKPELKAEYIRLNTALLERLKK